MAGLIAVCSGEAFAHQHAQHIHHVVKQPNKRAANGTFLPVTRKKVITKPLAKTRKAKVVKRHQVIKVSKRTHQERKRATSKKTGFKEQSQEPLPLPPTYEHETQLLLKVYSLRDQALNDQIRGDFGQAVNRISEAVEISNQYFAGKPAASEFQLYMDLAGAAESAGQADLAKKAYQESISRNPTAAGAHIRLANLLARLGEDSQALIEARKAVSLAPNDPRCHKLLSNLLEHQGHAEEAQAEKTKFNQLLKTKQIPKSGTQQNEPNQLLSEPTSDRQINIPTDMPLGLP